MCKRHKVREPKESGLHTVEATMGHGGRKDATPEKTTTRRQSKGSDTIRPVLYTDDSAGVHTGD